MIPLKRQRKRTQMRVRATSMMCRKTTKIVRKKTVKVRIASWKLQTIQRKSERRSNRSKMSNKIKMTRLITPAASKTIVHLK